MYSFMGLDDDANIDLWARRRQLTVRFPDEGKRARFLESEIMATFRTRGLGVEIDNLTVRMKTGVSLLLGDYTGLLISDAQKAEKVVAELINQLRQAIEENSGTVLD